jgi:hypothetical protein
LARVLFERRNMPDDCEELMEKYLTRLVNKSRQEQCKSVYKRYNNICDYCGGVAQKYSCVNCGAPQQNRIPPVSLF